MKFYFQVLDEIGGTAEMSADFLTVAEAKEEAKRALAESALDGIPGPPLNMYSVELFDAQHRPLVEYRLLFEEITK